MKPASLRSSTITRHPLHNAWEHSNTLRWCILGLFLALGLYQFIVITFLRVHEVAQRGSCSGVCIDVSLHARHPVSRVMYGLNFEDINHAGEGGLYPELVRDRSFDALAFLKNPPLAKHHPKNAAPQTTMRESELQKLSMDANSTLTQELRDGSAWEIVGTTHVSLTSTPELHNAIKIQCDNAGQLVQLVNKGHSLDGFYIGKGKHYMVTLIYRVPKKDIRDVTLALTSASGDQIYDSQTLTALSETWAKATRFLVSNAQDTEARIELRFMGPGTLELDYLSVMPTEDSNTRVYPFYHPLLSMLQAMQPRFLRFPAGDSVEGTDLKSAYRWKTTIGAEEDRLGHPNVAHGYWSTDGLGFFEFLWLAEELGAEAVFVVNIGISAQESVGPDALGPWIQDALDALEFARGPETSKWGQVRADMGRQRPFRLNYLSLGGGSCARPYYRQHYERISNVIRTAYPGNKVTLLANCDLGERAEYDAWEFSSYRDPESTFALRSAISRYNGKPVAIRGFNAGAEHVKAAIAEAGLMSAAENACDMFHMLGYQNVLGLADASTERPSLVVFEKQGSGKMYGTVPYHVHKLYMQHAGMYCLHRYQWFGRGAHHSSLLVESSATCLDTECHQVSVKVVNFSQDKQDVMLQFTQDDMVHNRMVLAPMGALTTLTGKANAENSLQQPELVKPMTRQIHVKEQTALQVPPYSLSILLVEFDVE